MQHWRPRQQAKSVTAATVSIGSSMASLCNGNSVSNVSGSCSLVNDNLGISVNDLCTEGASDLGCSGALKTARQSSLDVVTSHVNIWSGRTRGDHGTNPSVSLLPASQHVSGNKAGQMDVLSSTSVRAHNMIPMRQLVKIRSAEVNMSVVSVPMSSSALLPVLNIPLVHGSSRIASEALPWASTVLISRTNHSSRLYFFPRLYGSAAVG